MNMLKLATTLALCALLAGCSTFDRLKSVGEPPPLTAINDPTAQPGYRPVHMPMPQAVVASYQPNSLFSNEARGFFKDQRAHRIGDILTVIVTIDDSAQISNSTARARSSSNNAGLGGVIGSAVGNMGGVPGIDITADGSISTQSGLADSGNGSVNRKESLETLVAAVVTQVLPNGNLVIEGRQEVRVNFEVRDLIVAGIVRPEDIHADNTIPSSKIAEARIAYGGRGQITDVQQPRYGQQIADAILPF
ncbi:MAG TPA: flagellar basal body L-ring protein FlgH [Devosiaceae bacterium]|jgi:flagellar L-ring protein precursor FlgH|nr:flagellar basal body L-ring protein FlgH [Devosiaceae bacterium]